MQVKFVVVVPRKPFSEIKEKTEQKWQDSQPKKNFRDKDQQKERLGITISALFSAA
jgi:hypothetical protein